MKISEYNGGLCLLPENVYDAYRLGRLSMKVPAITEILETTDYPPTITKFIVKAYDLLYFLENATIKDKE